MAFYRTDEGLHLCKLIRDLNLVIEDTHEDLFKKISFALLSPFLPLSSPSFLHFFLLCVHTYGGMRLHVEARRELEGLVLSGHHVRFGDQIQFACLAVSIFTFRAILSGPKYFYNFMLPILNNNCLFFDFLLSFSHEFL